MEQSGLVPLCFLNRVAAARALGTYGATTEQGPNRAAGFLGALGPVED